MAQLDSASVFGFIRRVSAAKPENRVKHGDSQRFVSFSSLFVSPRETPQIPVVWCTLHPVVVERVSSSRDSSVSTLLSYVVVPTVLISPLSSSDTERQMETGLGHLETMVYYF